MALIKKSVSDIERKVEYARIVMRVLKECRLVKEFIDYTETSNYRNFLKRYMDKNPDCTDAWYDKINCGNILGTCNFENYLETRGDGQRASKYNTYNLVLAYLAIFHPHEYKRSRKIEGPKDFIKSILNGKAYDCGNLDEEMVKKWLKLKEILHGNKDLFTRLEM